MIVLLICSISSMAFGFVEIAAKSLPFKPFNCERCMSVWFGLLASIICLVMKDIETAIILACCPYICTRLINKILWQ